MTLIQSLKSMFDMLTPVEVAEIQRQRTEHELLEAKAMLEDVMAQVPKLEKRLKRLNHLLDGKISGNNVTPIRKPRKAASHEQAAAV